MACIMRDAKKANKPPEEITIWGVPDPVEEKAASASSVTGMTVGSTLTEALQLKLKQCNGQRNVEGEEHEKIVHEAGFLFGTDIDRQICIDMETKDLEIIYKLDSQLRPISFPFGRLPLLWHLLQSHLR
ncbi:Carbonic Anhydrase 13 [Manis pentadactyla]|nr:Carbonic Anhydrase 13 [Manis pentadactyla]